MPLYKFGKKDIFRNQIKTYSDCNLFIYGGNVYHNNKSIIAGAFTDSVPHVPSGYINLYELNVDRPAGSIAYPFVAKDGSLNAFKTVSTTDFNAALYGDLFLGTYPLSASITRERFKEEVSVSAATDENDNVSVNKPHLEALKTTFNFYTKLSKHYEYSSSLGDKSYDELTLVSIPSIFYGSSIKKGSVNLKLYVTGTLAGELADEKRNGELIQVGPTGSGGSGSIAGVVLYNEGFMALTASWAISDHEEEYRGSGNDAVSPAWKFFGAGMPVSGQDSDLWTATPLGNTSYTLSFQGTNYTQVVTMLAHAPRAMLNHSNNPSYLEYGQTIPSFVDVKQYIESDTIAIKNVVSGTYPPQSASFAKETYISKIGIYDEDRNLIAIAKMAIPVKKTEERDFTFKLKLDI